MKRPGSPASLLFRLIVPVCAIFILTILAMIATLFGDPRAPIAQWLERHGNTLLAIEFAATLGLSILAMTIDRIRTLRTTPKTPSATAPETPEVAPNSSGTESVPTDSPAS